MSLSCHCSCNISQQWPTTNNYVRRISSQRTPPKEDKQMDKRTQRSDESIYMAILKLSHLLNKNQLSTTKRKKYTRSNKKHQNSEEAQNTFPTDPQFPAVIPWITRYQPKPNKPSSRMWWWRLEKHTLRNNHLVPDRTRNKISKIKILPKPAEVKKQPFTMNDKYLFGCVTVNIVLNACGAMRSYILLWIVLSCYRSHSQLRN